MNKLLTTLILSACCLTAAADSKQIVTINGQQQSQTVKKLTFSDSNVILTFADGSTQTVDMENVTIAFTYQEAVNILNTVSDKDTPTRYFDLKGQQLKKAPKKGAYIIQKGNKVVKLLTK